MFLLRALVLFCILIYSQGYAKSPIPRTAHFCYGLWDDGKIPDHFEKTMKQWKNQGWNVRLWNRKQVDQLLSKYPEFNELSSTFTRKVQKADLARYLIIYEHGGFYFDLDCRPDNNSLFQDLKNGMLNSSALFFIECELKPEFAEETKQYPIRQGVPEDIERIANFAFGAVENHPIIWQLLELLYQRCNTFPNYNDDYDILYKTGPDCMTQCVHDAQPSSEIQVIHNRNYLYHQSVGTWKNKRDLK